MVEILEHDDDKSVAWLEANQRGYVLNSYAKPNAQYLVLHRATCRDISGKPARGKSWTHDYLKVCALNPDDLREWARQQTGGEVKPCKHCNP
jgi:hypothetical protein